MDVGVSCPGSSWAVGPSIQAGLGGGESEAGLWGQAVATARAERHSEEMRVLVVEDSNSLRSSLTIALQASGHAVDGAADGRSGLELALATAYDVVVLDVQVPELDGFELLRKMRESGHEARVLFLTARDALEDRVEGLRMGADDYVTKPFELEEFLARVDALGRRRYGQAARTLAVGDLVVDTEARSVQWRGHPADLTAREYAVLELLMRRRNQVVRREEIEEHVYDGLDAPMSNVVDRTVYQLRKKLSRCGEDCGLLQTRRGLGYILTADGVGEDGGGAEQGPRARGREE